MDARRLLQLLLPIILPAMVVGTESHADSSHLLLLSGVGQETAISAPRQSIPAPVHDEAICAFCQAAAFAPQAASPTYGLAEAPDSEEQELIARDARLPHVGSSRPPSSRAPPALRDS